MKVPPRNLESFIKNPPPEIVALLVYGPDEGLMRERMNILTKNIVTDIKDPFNVVEFSAKELSDMPSRLLDEAMSLSMLGDRRVVRLHSATDSITSIVKSAISEIKPGGNLIVLGADNLSPRSTLRSFFEAEKNLAAIPCYVDDERNIGRVIQDSLKESGYTAPYDVINYISAHVVGDRAIARSEIEKLIIYMGNDNKNISLEDARACIGNSADLDLGDLAKFVASGNFVEAERILNHVFQEGLPAIAVLRNLQNYFMRLHLTKSHIEKGATLDAAIKKLKPPIFFKLRPSFESHVRNWNIGQIEQSLALLSSVEAKCKQTNSQPETLCGRAVLSLAQMGNKAAHKQRSGNPYS